MSRLLALSLAAGCALTVAACGSSGTPSGSNSTTSNLTSQAVAFARCMRSHGVTDYPDPTNNGGLSYPGSTSSPAFKSARTACAGLEPHKIAPSSGPETPQQTAQSTRAVTRVTDRQSPAGRNLPAKQHGAVDSTTKPLYSQEVATTTGERQPLGY